MNAVERFWDALAAGDSRRAGEELHGHITVEWPHSGRRFGSREEFLMACAEAAGPASIDVARIVTQGRSVAAEIHLSDHRVIAGFYRLHDGRVRSAVEYWVELPRSAA